MYSPYTASHEMYGGANPYGGYPHHHGATQYHHHTAPRSGLQMPHSSSSSYPTPQQFSSASNTPMQRQRTPNNATQHNNTPAGAAGGRTIAAGGAGWYQQQGHYPHHNPLQQYPTPNSNSSFQKGAAPWMNQQQQLQSTSISPVAINGASSMKNHHSAYYYNNSQQQQQQQQQQHSGSGTVSAATAATATSLADKICPMSGKGLERELMCATKEELVQVLLDLSSCNIAASTFIQSKAQLFSLQATHMMGFTEEMAVTMTPTVTISIGRTTTSAPPTAPQGAPATIAPAMATATNESQELTTPSKELFSLDDSSASWQSRFSSAAKELNTMESPVSASAPPAAAATSSAVTVGKTPVRRELQERHITPETRAFAAEVHPCLRLYGACRHSVNCIFKTLPRNLCLHWIRGSCAGGADCGCVHRFPVNCPEQVRTVYELSHGGDRIEVAKRAESTAERVRVAAAAAVATSAASGLALVGTPERQRFSVSNHHQKLELSPIPYTMDEEDMESAVTPRNENQRISTLMAKAAASSGQDHLTAAREAHQLMTAASATAEEIDTPTTAAVERCLKDSFDAVMDDDEPSTI